MKTIKNLFEAFRNRPRVTSGFFSSNLTIYVNDQIASIAKHGLVAVTEKNDQDEVTTRQVRISHKVANNAPNETVIKVNSDCQARSLIKKIYKAKLPLHVRVFRFTAWLTLFVIILNSTPAKLPETANPLAQQAAPAAIADSQISQELGLPATPFAD